MLTSNSAALDTAHQGPVQIAENDPQFLLNHLAANDATAYLQDGLNGLELIQTNNSADKLTTLFQQTFDGIPVHNAFVTVVKNSTEPFASFDRGHQNLAPRVSAEATLSGLQAIQIASAEMDAAGYTNTSTLNWLRSGDQARLTWRVDAFSAAMSTPEWTTFVDAHTGSVIEQQESPRDEIAYLMENPETLIGVYPRIVINNNIGASGSRSYAAPFDSVVSISVGCTGTLIAPDTVISARHCSIGSGDQIRFGDNSGSPIYTATVSSTLLPDGNGTLLDGGDVSIHTLTQNVPSSVATPMRLIDETSSLVGSVAATLGYGYNGLGSSGHGFSADGFRWGGENIIDVYGSPAAQSGSNIFSTDFDNGTSSANTIGSSSAAPLTYEATTAPGDSGGPLLVQVGSEWVIAGVLSGGTTNTSVYGDISWWTGVAPYKADIEARGGQFVGSANGAGTVAFDADTYVAGDTVGITVSDPNGSSSVSVNVTSSSGDSETLTFGGGGTSYTGDIVTSDGGVSANDGTLQVSSGDTITVTYVDPDDGTGNSLTVSDTASILVGNIAVNESNVFGTMQGDFTDTHTSNNVREIITEDRYGGRRTRLEHSWDFNVSGGGDVTFNLEAYHNSSVEDFAFEYSTNGGSTWNSMLTLTQNSESSQSVNLGSGISGSVVVRVTDTSRERGDSVRDSVFIDEMYFDSGPPSPGVVVAESGGNTEATEGGSGDTYTIALETAPTSNVTVTVDPDSEVDLGNGPGNPVSLTFTPQNALTPQTVIVNAVDDSLDESSHTGLITHSVSSSDGGYNGLSVPNVTVAITDNDSTGGGTDVATGESSVDGSITSGSFADTHTSNNVSEAIIEELYGGNKRSRLEHHWNFNVSGGSSVTFNLEARKSAGVDDFVFQLSTNGGSSWTTLATVGATTDTTFSTNVGNVAGDVIVRVRDTVRQRGDNIADTIFIDEMNFVSTGVMFTPLGTELATVNDGSDSPHFPDATAVEIGLPESARSQYEYEDVDQYFRVGESSADLIADELADAHSTKI